MVAGQKVWKQAFALGLAVMVGACSTSRDEPAEEKTAPVKVDTRPTLSPVSYAALPDWGVDDVAKAMPALRRSCETFMRMPETKILGPYGMGGQAGDWKPVCTQAFEVPDGDNEKARAFFESYFQPYVVADLNDDTSASGLFTGYYEAGLNGARSKGGIYQTPLYKRPDDLVLIALGDFKPEWKGKRLAGRLEKGQLVPFATRADIESGVLRGKKLELVWVDDPVDAFFLHIQGSGRVLFADGTSMRVGYDGHNGHDYTSIGRILIDRGEVARENMSMQTIRKWMAEHPKKGRDLMRENSSFIFFRELKDDGPIGAQGVALTAGRSMAVDKRYMTLGLPIFVHTFTDPVLGKPDSRLVIAQDTGGAIKGVVRGDLFWGFGEEAAERAGKMKETGSMFVLLPLNTLARCEVCVVPQDSDPADMPAQ